MNANVIMRAHALLYTRYNHRPFSCLFSTWLLPTCGDCVEVFAALTHIESEDVDSPSTRGREESAYELLRHPRRKYMSRNPNPVLPLLAVKLTLQPHLVSGLSHRISNSLPRQSYGKNVEKRCINSKVIYIFLHSLICLLI